MFRDLARKKQALSLDECVELLKNEKRGVLSVIGDEGYPYGMPMNHFYAEVDNCLYFHLMICLDDGHKTTKNILESKAFTVSIADAKHVVEADYVGIASGNKIKDKMSEAGLTTVRSSHVNAPIINEFPMTIECNLLKFNEDGICIGEIVNVCADESVLGTDGMIDPEKLEAITYDSVHHKYIKLGDVVGNAFSDGKKLVR